MTAEEARLIVRLFADVSPKLYEKSAHPECELITKEIAALYAKLAQGGGVTAQECLDLWEQAQRAWWIAQKTDPYRAGYVARAAIHASRAARDTMFKDSDIDYVAHYLLWAAHEENKGAIEKALLTFQPYV